MLVQADVGMDVDESGGFAGNEKKSKQKLDMVRVALSACVCMCSASAGRRSALSRPSFAKHWLQMQLRFA